MNKKVTPRRRSQAGFTLIELLVVVLIIGILAAVAVPQYFKVVEKGKAAESFAYIDGVKAAEEETLTRTGTYFTGATIAAIGAASTVINLPTTMKYFTAAVAQAGTDYTLTLTRAAPVSAYYGGYTVTFTRSTGATVLADCVTGGAACPDLTP